MTIDLKVKFKVNFVITISHYISNLENDEKKLLISDANSPALKPYLKPSDQAKAGN